MIPLTEDLLLPLLELAVTGEWSVQRATWQLALRFPLSQAEQGELRSDFSGSPFSSRVGTAWHLLRRAGLIESSSRAYYCRISDRGRMVLAQKLDRLSVSDLEQFPEFLKAREDDRRRYQANEFRELRFEYYASGRKLLAAGAFSAAPILLGYAIEVALKAGLQKVAEQWEPADKRLVMSSHDLQRLYERSRQLGAFTDTFIASDFLHYARDHFSRRYPTGAHALSEQRGGWSIGTHKLASYDDCLCQLDDSLVKKSGDPQESVLYFGLFDPRARPLAHELFFDNPFAAQRVKSYRETFVGTQRNGSLFAELQKDTERSRQFEADFEMRREVLDLGLAALYRYPRHGEPDPDPLLCRDSDSWAAVQVQWLLSRLREAFGNRNIRVAQKRRPKDHLSIHVFDRTARQWWAELPLGSRLSLTDWRRNPRTEMHLETFIESTRQQFCKKRRGLRVPPGWGSAPRQEVTEIS